MNQKISAVIITKNEENAIGRCLASLKWCDEVVVLDSHSEDKTTQIASQLGAAVFSSPFLGYGEQKILATSKASNDWILSVDADEVISAELAAEIKQLIQQVANPQIAYKIPRTLVFINKKMNFSGENRRPILRLFHRQFFNFNRSSVHEEVVGNGEVEILRHEMLHYSYTSWNDYLNKLNHYTEKMAQKMHQQGTAKLPLLGLRFWSTFLRVYLLRLGFLDGSTGFAWAISCAYANMLKYAKYSEKFT